MPITVSNFSVNGNSKKSMTLAPAGATVGVGGSLTLTRPVRETATEASAEA